MNDNHKPNRFERLKAARMIAHEVAKRIAATMSDEDVKDLLAHKETVELAVYEQRKFREQLLTKFR